MYLVLSALTSSPISLVAANKASAFSFKVCIPPPGNVIYIYFNAKTTLFLKKMLGSHKFQNIHMRILNHEF